MLEQVKTFGTIGMNECILQKGHEFEGQGNNAMVWMFVSSNLYIEILMPYVMVLEVGPLGSDYITRAPPSWMRLCPYKRGSRELACPFAMWRYNEKSSTQKEGSHLIMLTPWSWLPASRIMRNKFLLLWEINLCCL